MEDRPHGKKEDAREQMARHRKQLFDAKTSVFALQDLADALPSGVLRTRLQRAYLDARSSLEGADRATEASFRHERDE